MNAPVHCSHPGNQPALFVYVDEDGIPAVCVSELAFLDPRKLPPFKRGHLSEWRDALCTMFSGCAIIDINPRRFRIIPN